jgi:hypothetical protein
VSNLIKPEPSKAVGFHRSSKWLNAALGSIFLPQQQQRHGVPLQCDLYREWCETISPTMRQAHGPAEKLFVDFAGDTVPVFDAATAA